MKRSFGRWTVALLAAAALVAPNQVPAFVGEGLQTLPHASGPAAEKQDEATLSYRKVFKGSSPEYTEVRIQRSGGCTYDIRSLDDDPGPQPCALSQPLIERLFALAAELNYFNGVELDVRRRIANLGQKTFRYQQNGQASEVTFNYTLNATASQLLQLFEGVARQFEHADRLRHRMRYDRLGVHQALLHLEADLNRKILPEPQSLLPVLEAIAEDSRYLEIARQRARALIARIDSTR